MWIANILFVILSIISPISIQHNVDIHKFILVDSLPAQLRVGCLLHEHQYEQEIVFRWTIDQINKKQYFKRTRLVGVVRKVKSGDSFDAGRKACELLSEGAIAIIGPPDNEAAPHVASICDSLDVPHFNVVPKRLEFISQSQSLQLTQSWLETVNNSSGNQIDNNNRYKYDHNNNYKYNSNPNTEGNSNIKPRSSGGSFVIPSIASRNNGIDMSIRRSVLYEAYLDLVTQAIKWRQFVYVYEHDNSLFYLQQLLLQRRISTSDMNMRIVKLDPTQPYRNTFWKLRASKARLIMLDVECAHLQTVLEHAQQVSMMTEANGYVIVCLDTQTLNLDPFKHSRTQIVWMNAIDLDNTELEAMSQRDLANPSSSSSIIESGSFRLIPERLHVESARIHDAVMTITFALKDVDSSKYFENPPQVSCDQAPRKTWPDESTIMNYIKAAVEFKGMTGQVRFDSFGHRSNYNLNILRLTEFGPVTVGNWSQSGKQRIRLASADEAQELKRDDKYFLDTSERRDLLIVTSIINDPYFMNKQTTRAETGNGRYEGYAVDLIDELSRIVGFDYIFKEVDDGKYGAEINETTNEWNGMINEVMIGKADMAIADLSITAKREGVVDFTLPFMNTGISVLFKKPTTKELEFFSFLSPFEGHVWVYVIGAYVGVSVLLFIVGRVSPYEWTDPHPCRREDRILRNQFSLVNSFWFTMAAVMQQGSDLAPKSLSTRLVAAIWYFFTLIMISSYTANLAAFLTVEKVVFPIEKAEDLYEHPQNIRYGCLLDGSTHQFFKTSRPGSTFKKMAGEMVLVKSNDEGKAEVEKGDYAYFMESILIEYNIERQCNLTQIGGLLDSKGYGIALAKNSSRSQIYRTKLSEGILSLQENGLLEVLKNRWWKEKRGGGACDDANSNSDIKNLTLENVGGVFAIVLIGITAGFVLLAQELYKKSSRLAAAQGTSKWEQLKRRIRFAMDLDENY